MDVQERIADALVQLSEQQNKNHLEVCQRLTAVETKLDGLAPLEDRVRKLEGWRNTFAGFTIAANMAFAGALAWFKHR